MAYNKVEANGETLIDLTSDTVTADTLVSGRTAHLASGERVTGTFEPVTGVKGNAESTYRKGDVNLTPANIGLGNVNNTSDLDKPISTATQAALDAQQAQIDDNSEISETSDTTPYIYKSSEHDAVYDELVGGSVAWNQLAKPISSWGYAGIDVSTSSDGVMTINGTATGNTYPILNDVEYSISGHKYYVTLNRTDLQSGINLYNGSNGIDVSNGKHIQEATGSDRWYLRILYGTVCDNVKVTPQIIDLTQMFGTTIADYVYNLEQSTAGSGVEWLKSYGFFTKDYYAYNAGGLISVNTSGKKVVSETTEITYPIQSTDLRGLYKLNGNKLYTDGDIYSADGTVTRKYGIVDLGTLDWTYSSTDKLFYSSTVSNGITPISPAPNSAVCPKYTIYTGNDYSSGFLLMDKVFCYSWSTFSTTSRIVIKDSSYTDAATFKTAMSSIYLIYELKTPTTENAQPFASPQMVYRNGTEEYLDTRDVPIPIGGNRKYVDIPDWMVNEYFDDLRAETSTLLVKIENINNGINEIESDMRGVTQDLDDISEELDCLTIQAALVNNEVIIQNTSDFTDELYRKYASHTKPKFAILELHITSSTHYYKALINTLSVSQATVMEASFITVNGTYMSIYEFNWSLSGTVGTPTVSHTSLNLGS